MAVRRGCCPVAAGDAREAARLRAGADRRGGRRRRCRSSCSFVALLWLVPTFGLFITSIMPISLVSQEGWWKFFSHPSIATYSNYRALYDNSTITSSLRTTAEIAIGGTVLPIMIAALAGYAFAWLEFPGRECSSSS